MSTAHIDKILTEQSVSKLQTYLKRQPTESLAAVFGYDPLDQLNPAVHSLGYLHILYAPFECFQWLVLYPADVLFS